MFQVWIGPRSGLNEKIIPTTSFGAAEKIAREQVLTATVEGQSRITHIFSDEKGIVVAGFATKNLADEISKLDPSYTIL